MIRMENASDEKSVVLILLLSSCVRDDLTNNRNNSVNNSANSENFVSWESVWNICVMD